MLASVMMLTLASCAAVGPDYRAPQPAHADTWKYATANPGQIEGSEREDLSQWWLKLGDERLSGYIQSALAASPDARSAQSRLREARARRALAGANRFPTVTGSAGASRSNGSEETGSGASRHFYNAGFDASWEPDIFGGLRRAEEAAEAELGGAVASLQDTQVTLAAEVALNYVEYRLNQQRLNIARENLALQDETLQITEWRELAGLATQLDVEQARTNREQTQAAIPALATSMTEAEHRLTILIGQQPGSLQAELAAPAAFPQLPERVAIGIPAETLRQRPDIRLAERTLAAETARIGQETAALYPSFSLDGSVGLEALTLSALFNSAALATSVAGNMAATVFDAGRIRSRIDIQNEIQAQALASYEKTVLTALGEVEDALVSYANTQARENALMQARQAARNAAELAGQRYQSGLVDYQVVLETERTKFTVEDNLASAHAAIISSLIRLYKALGGGWNNDTQRAGDA